MDLFYIGLENQIHLLVIVIFSAYIYLSSLTIQLDSFIKNYGTSFFVPLILCIMSFLSLNASLSESYLFFSEFMHLTAILIILASKNKKDFNYVIYIMLYAFPLLIAVLNLNFGFWHNNKILTIILSFYIVIIFAVIVYRVLMKKYSLMVLYTGTLSVCASLLIPRVNTLNIAVVLALLFKASGYLFFAYFFYKSTVHKLEKEHLQSSRELNRINENIQREINRRVADIERSNKGL